MANAVEEVRGLVVNNSDLFRIGVHGSYAASSVRSSRRDSLRSGPPTQMHEATHPATSMHEGNVPMEYSGQSRHNSHNYDDYQNPPTESFNHNSDQSNPNPSLSPNIGLSETNLTNHNRDRGQLIQIASSEFSEVQSVNGL